MARNEVSAKTDQGLLAWANNAAAVLADSAPAYSVPAAMVAAFNSANLDFADALAACEPNIRTAVAVVVKKQKRAVLLTQIRLLSNYVNGIATVTDAQKLTLGLTVRRQPRPAPVPQQAPVVHVVAVTGRTVTLSLHATASAKRGKPSGVALATVFTAVSATMPTETTAYQFFGNVTKPTFDVTFEDGANTAWVTAAWGNAKGESGTSCSPVRIDLPAVPPVPQPNTPGMKIAA